MTRYVYPLGTPLAAIAPGRTGITWAEYEAQRWAAQPARGPGIVEAYAPMADSNKAR